MRHSEGVSYHDGQSDKSSVLREDTDFLNSNLYKINSTRNSMFIRYYSDIEQPRVYGVLLRFNCMPTASTILKRKLHKDIDSLDQGCFIEDNTIEARSTKKYRSWRIPGSGDRHYKKMSESKDDFDKLPHAVTLKKSRQSQQSSVDKRFKPRNDSEVLHPVFALYENRKSVRGRSTKPKNLLTKNPMLKKGSSLNKYHPRTVVKKAKKSSMEKVFLNEDYYNLVKGHEHQELLQPQPDLTIIVQPSKIDYSGSQNNGGVRFFIHRTYSVPIDPRDSIEVDNNVETFINLEYDDVDLLSGEFQRDKGCFRRVTRKNLWYDLEVELYNPLTYTLDSCIHEWQVKTMFKACKCLPHYYSELFDYWWNKNLRCNHQGLKCMALVNGK